MVLYNVLTLTFIVLIYYSSCLFKRKLSELEGFKTVYRLLLGLSKGNARVKIPPWFFFFVQSQIAVKTLTRMRDVLILTHGRRFGR